MFQEHYWFNKSFNEKCHILLYIHANNSTFTYFYVSFIKTRNNIYLMELLYMIIQYHIYNISALKFPWRKAALFRKHIFNWKVFLFLFSIWYNTKLIQNSVGACNACNRKILYRIYIYIYIVDRVYTQESSC